MNQPPRDWRFLHPLTICAITIVVASVLVTNLIAQGMDAPGVPGPVVGRGWPIWFQAREDGDPFYEDPFGEPMYGALHVRLWEEPQAEPGVYSSFLFVCNAMVAVLTVAGTAWTVERLARYMAIPTGVSLRVMFALMAWFASMLAMGLNYPMPWRRIAFWVGLLVYSGALGVAWFAAIDVLGVAWQALVGKKRPANDTDDGTGFGLEES